MNSDENFEILKRIKKETAEKEADQKEDIIKEAVAKARKVKALNIQKRKEKCG